MPLEHLPGGRGDAGSGAAQEVHRQSGARGLLGAVGIWVRKIYGFKGQELRAVGVAGFGVLGSGFDFRRITTLGP